ALLLAAADRHRHHVELAAAHGLGALDADPRLRHRLDPLRRDLGPAPGTVPLLLGHLSPCCLGPSLSFHPSYEWGRRNYARCKCSRTWFSASLAVRLCTSARVPPQFHCRDVAPPSHARPTWTSPIGFSGVAPPGPARPTVLTARSVPSRAR